MRQNNGADFKHRHIKSFARRSGRLSVTQKQAINELWAEYGLDYQPTTQVFEQLLKQHPILKIEIGFGNGDALIEMAQKDPEAFYVGIEVHTPGVGRTLLNIHHKGIKNLKIMSHDAIEILQNMLPDNAINRAFLFFPDPWHKLRHHKRRIVNEQFRDLLAAKLQNQGVIHMATDWQNYAQHMADEFLSDKRFLNLGNQLGFSPKPSYRPQTKFETRGIKLSHSISDLLFEKTSQTYSGVGVK